MSDDQLTPSAPEPVTSARQAPAQSFAIPLAIVAGFGLIAAAIYFSGTGGSTPLNVLGGNNPTAAEEEPTTGPIRPVDDTDHIRGNPNAPIVIVEYSDFDCPFCKNFHDTMNQVMDNYGTDGKVAWIYRHFPLEQLHPSAPFIAEASECVAKLGGNEAFWKFADQVFEERNTNEPTNLARLNEFAVNAGVSESAFVACTESGEVRNLVEEDFNDALNAGARGTPHSIITVGGQEGVINGAQPYSVVSQIIDNLLTQVEQ